MEELLQPEMSEKSLELCNDLPRYPDNWPLPPTPFAISSEGLNEQDAAPRSRSGVFTPPLQGVQPTTARPATAQPTPPMSASSRVLRSSSNASAKSPHRKRLSLSFPIAPSTYASPHTPTTPTDYVAPSPNGSMAFLTALAAQERRVLELREELAKSETELAKLKRQWSIHEATKQRHELLQTEIILVATGDVAEGIKSPTTEEHEARRRAALAKLTQASTRSVTSQRHHRTLSLLSPQRASYPQPRDLQVNAEPVRGPTPVRRSDTLPTQPTRPLSMTETSSSSVRAALGIKRNSQDMIMQTGKQMAEGFKEGLWAFVEDLRQATVGEDMPPRPPMSRSNSSLGAPGVRRQGSKASLRSVSSSGGSRRGREKSPVKTDLTSDSQQTSHDETPSGRWSTASSVFSETSSIVSVSHSRSSTPRTSTSSVQSSGFIGAPAGVAGVQGLGALMSVGTQFSLKKAAGVVVRGLETALEGALALDEHEERYKREVREREKTKEGEAERAGQVSSRVEGVGTTLLRRRSVRAAGEGKTKKA